MKLRAVCPKSYKTMTEKVLTHAFGHVRISMDIVKLGITTK